MAEQAPNRLAVIAAQIIAGMVIGLLLGAAVGWLLARIVPARPGGFGDLIAGVIGAGAAYLIGVVVGVWLIGRQLRRPVAIGLVIGGALAGGALILLLAEPLRLNSNPTILQAAFIITAPALATLATQFRKTG